MEVIEWSRLIARTLSVPLHRYSAPAVRGIEGVRQDDLLVRALFLPLSRGIRRGLLSYSAPLKGHSFNPLENLQEKYLKIFDRPSFVEKILLDHGFEQ